MLKPSFAGLPPGPSLPRAVQTALLWRFPRWWLDTCHRRYGDVFAVHAAPMGTLVFLADPADIKTVFAGDPAVYRAGEAASVLRGILGDGSLLLLDEQRHRDRRRLMMSPFHRDAVHRQSELMAEIAAADVAAWPLAREFPVAPRMAAITLEVILRIVIGSRDERRLCALRRALPAVVEANPLATMAMANPDLLRRRPWRGVRRRREEADRLLFTEIAHCRADPELADRTDVLAMLVRAADSDGRGMTDAELRDQLMTLLMAGHETTATALSWALERLVRHPEVLRRAVEAADTGDEDYLDAVVRETLRIRPVVFDVARTLAAPVELGGYRLPAGVLVSPAIGLVQLSARHYPDPKRFAPERMIGTTPSPTTWLPFGGGARRCLGATFAQVEMRIVLREVLRRVELVPTSGSGERQRMKLITLVPHRGGRIRVRARRAAPVPA
ncbi:MAG: cytochrome P450 [Pseudonocardia sp.]